MKYQLVTRLMVAVQPLCPRHFLTNSESGHFLGRFGRGQGVGWQVPAGDGVQNSEIAQVMLRTWGAHNSKLKAPTPAA